MSNKGPWIRTFAHVSPLRPGRVPQEGTGAPEGPGAHEQGRYVRDFVVQKEYQIIQEMAFLCR